MTTPWKPFRLWRFLSLPWPRRSRRWPFHVFLAARRGVCVVRPWRTLIQSSTRSGSAPVFHEMRLPRLIGTAQVSASATLYLASSMYALLLGWKAISSCRWSGPRAPPRRQYGPHCPRCVVGQSVAPVLASMQKKLRPLEVPKSKPSSIRACDIDGRPILLPNIQ